MIKTLFAAMKTRFILTLLLLCCVIFGNAKAVATTAFDPNIGANLDGSFTQGGLLIGTTVEGAKVSIDGRPIRVSKDGKFLIGFGRDAKRIWILSIEHPDQKTFDSSIEITERQYNIQRIDGLPPSTVTPSAEVLARIREETAQVKEARTTDHARTDFLQTFDWPIHGVITGVYGSQRILNGEPRRPHFGVDISAPEGAIVRAPASGIVTLNHPDMFFSGGTLIIDHGHGLSSTFIHLNKILVAKGEYVHKNQEIATVGSTGRSTGPHLDWRINLFAQRLDPQLIVGEMPNVN